MNNTSTIVHMLRTGEYPARQVDDLIAADASAMIERIITSASVPTMRQHAVEYARQVHTAAAEVTRREVELRTIAALDAADARARLQHLSNAVAHMAVQVMGPIKWDDMSDEDRQALIDDPAPALRKLLGVDAP